MAQQVSSPGRSHEPLEQELAAGHTQVTEAVLGAPHLLRVAHPCVPVPQIRAPPWAVSPRRSPLHRSSKARVSKTPYAPAGSSTDPAASSPGSARRGRHRKSSIDSALPRLAASSHGPRPQPAPEATPHTAPLKSRPEPAPREGSPQPPTSALPAFTGATPPAHPPLDCAPTRRGF